MSTPEEEVTGIAAVGAEIQNGVNGLIDDVAERSGFNRVMDNIATSIEGFFGSIASWAGEFFGGLLNSALGTVGNWMGAPTLNAMNVIDDSVENPADGISLDPITTSLGTDITRLVAEEIEANGNGVSRGFSYAPTLFSSGTDEEQTQEFLSGRALSTARDVYGRVKEQTITDLATRIATELYTTPTEAQIATVRSGISTNADVLRFANAEAQAISGVRPGDRNNYEVIGGGVYASVLAALQAEAALPAGQTAAPITSIATGTHGENADAIVASIAQSVFDQNQFAQLAPTLVAALDATDTRNIQTLIAQDPALIELLNNNAAAIAAALESNSLLDTLMDDPTARYASIEGGGLRVTTVNGTNDFFVPAPTPAPAPAADAGLTH